MEKKFILVAEDDKAYAHVYKNKLESEGFDVVVVERGDEVIAELKKRKPDLLIQDLMMPGKSGFEILEEKFNDPTLKGIKVVVASNLSQAVDMDKVMALGVTEYIVKSDISIADLISKIHALVK